MIIYLIHAGFSKIKIPYIGEVISLNYISANLKQHGYTPYVFDCLLEEISQDTMLNNVIQNMPSIIYLSYYESNSSEAEDFVRKLRSLNYLQPIVFVGIYVTLNTISLFNKLSDVQNIWCIRGEPEEIALKFAKEIKNGICKSELNEMVYKTNEGLHNINHVNIVKDIDKLPFPDCSVMDRVYGKINVSAYISSSRGCYGNCSFCILNVYNSAISASNDKIKWRERSINSVADEMEFLTKHYPDTLIKFADSNFIGYNMNRGIALSKELKRRNIKTKFAIECRANDVNEENFKALKEVGLVSVFLGIESGSQSVLMRYNKEISVQQNQEAIDIIRKLNIGLKMGFILFDELSTIDELEENTEFLHRNCSCVFHPYRPLIMERNSYNNRKSYPCVIRDERTNLAYELISETCNDILPYRAKLDILRKKASQNDAIFKKKVYNVLGKFILFDKCGMDLLISMCKNSTKSSEVVKNEFRKFKTQFLTEINTDFTKFEDYEGKQ